jgi:hypothetical protein
MYALALSLTYTGAHWHRLPLRLESGLATAEICKSGAAHRVIVFAAATRSCTYKSAMFGQAPIAAWKRTLENRRFVPKAAVRSI